MALPAAYRPPLGTYLLDTSITLDNWAAPATDTTLTEWWVTSLDGWYGTPDLRLTGVDRPQDHGQVDGPSYLAARVITITGVAIAPDRPTAMNARDIITSLCWDPTQLYTLQVAEPGRPTKRCDVRLNTATKATYDAELTFDWSMQLKAPDPRKYADTETVVTLTPPTGAVGGVPFPTTFPATFTTTGLSTSTTTLTNAGTIATRPTVILAGPLADPQIANTTTGRSLAFTGLNIAAGDTVVVDFDRRTALYNGTASRTNYLAAGAAWWDLAPGGNDIAFTAGGGNGTAEIHYRTAWL